jgi:hypothetical protein
MSEKPNWLSIAARYWPRHSISGTGEFAAVTSENVVLYQTRIERKVLAASNAKFYRLKPPVAPPRVRDLTCFEPDPA